PLLYVFFALAVAGLVIDLRLRRVRPMWTPQLGWVVAFLVWVLLTLVIRAPNKIIDNGMEAIVSVILYLLIAHSVQTLRGVQAMMGLLLALALFLTFVGVHQGLAPFGCFQIDPSNPNDMSVGIYDGRSCVEPA